MATVSERDKLEAEELEDRVIRIDRTRKTVAGGRLSSARVVVAVGDNRGHIGLGIGKARNVPEAIAKGIRRAKKNMIDIPLDGYTIPHITQAKVGGAVILLRPASRGTGIVAGGAVRQLIEISGIRDILTKSLGSGNVMNRAKACFKALSELRNPHEVAERRGITVDEMMRREIVNPYAKEEAEEEVGAEEGQKEVVAEAGDTEEQKAGEEVEAEAEERLTEEAGGEVENEEETQTEVVAAAIEGSSEQAEQDAEQQGAGDERE